MTSYEDNEQAQRAEGGQAVVCVWCGGVIRGGATRAAKRMCQPCFARMMSEHSRPREGRAGDWPRHASDR